MAAKTETWKKHVVDITKSVTSAVIGGAIMAVVIWVFGIRDTVTRMDAKMETTFGFTEKNISRIEASHAADVAKLEKGIDQSISRIETAYASNIARLEKAIDRLNERIVKTTYHGYKKGVITGFEGEGYRTLVAKDEGKEWKCTLTAETTITVDSKDAKMDALKVGMRIQALVDDDNNCISLEAETLRRRVIPRKESKD